MFEDISDDDINWEIKFDNASREYYSGSMLRGFAKIILNKTIIVRSIYVRVNGIGHIESSRQNHETNIDDKTFINKNIFLEKGESGQYESCLFISGLLNSSIWLSFQDRIDLKFLQVNMNIHLNANYLLTYHHLYKLIPDIFDIWYI